MRARRADSVFQRGEREPSSITPWSEIFSSHLSLAISPYVEIEDEVRVILLDDLPRVVYAQAARLGLAA